MKNTKKRDIAVKNEKWNSSDLKIKLMPPGISSRYITAKPETNKKLMLKNPLMLKKPFYFSY